MFTRGSMRIEINNKIPVVGLQFKSLELQKFEVYSLAIKGRSVHHFLSVYEKEVEICC